MPSCPSMRHTHGVPASAYPAPRTATDRKRRKTPRACRWDTRAAMPAEAATALVLEGVFAGYGETVVLEDIGFAIAPGESVSVIGRNGVGKSSLLATIMGHTTFRDGAIRLDGADVAAWPTARRSRAGIGYVPQEREVFASLTVTENLDVAARPGGGWSRERVFELFPRLAARRTSRGKQLSGGEQQMLAIGRALMGNPRVLLMDEPSEGLAPVIVEELERVITRVRDESGLAIVLVEQHIRFALRFSPRTLVLDRGRVVFEGPSADLADDATLHAHMGLA